MVLEENIVPSKNIFPMVLKREDKNKPVSPIIPTSKDIRGTATVNNNGITNKKVSYLNIFFFAFSGFSSQFIIAGKKSFCFMIGLKTAIRILIIKVF